MITKPIKLVLSLFLVLHILPHTALVPRARAGELAFAYAPHSSALNNQTDAFNDLVGEELHFKLSFLWFKRIADAEFYFAKADHNGRYYAQLRVEARGFARWVTQQRKHLYRSEFELVDGGRQLRTIYHMRKVSYWGNEEVFENRMDYASRKYVSRVFKNGQLIEEKTGRIPEGRIFEDVLSAFYNFRQGAFGQPVSGKTFRINTIPSSKGVNHFMASVATEREKKHLITRGERNFVGPYLILVDIPPEIFDSRTGDGRIWLNEEMIPVAGLIKDVKGLGDVVGTLQEVSFSLHNGNGIVVASGK